MRHIINITYLIFIFSKNVVTTQMYTEKWTKRMEEGLLKGQVPETVLLSIMLKSCNVSMIPCDKYWTTRQLNGCPSQKDYYELEQEYKEWREREKNGLTIAMCGLR